ncbi:YggS family pyridoxal phosphate-dependent enzyme [Leptolyngbya sp. DQ-M1]|uniref:YggS family pyridoxal phosphate-dependent enzyme n=1 Tax=Leptolyngbya sp. DQ-M1 TaxID=2933920 RepID=UPI003296B342
MISSLQNHIAEFRAKIPPHIRVIAVTKTVSVEAMRTAYAAGIRDFGENRVQEAETKRAELKDLTDVTWHLIGHLQSNKAKSAIDLFDWIHSVDSLKLAQRLDRLAEEQDRKPQICLQAKLMSDPNKSGFSVSELWDAIPQLEQLKHLHIRGLMVIPPFDLEAEATIALFRQARELAEKIRTHSQLNLDQLSMGMSGDYALAIQAGATMIRPGRVLFGARLQK